MKAAIIFGALTIFCLHAGAAETYTLPIVQSQGERTTIIFNPNPIIPGSGTMATPIPTCKQDETMVSDITFTHPLCAKTKYLRPADR
jgi:hypothetical protein